MTTDQQFEKLFREKFSPFTDEDYASFTHDSNFIARIIAEWFNDFQPQISNICKFQYFLAMAIFTAKDLKMSDKDFYLMERDIRRLCLDKLEQQKKKLS